MRIDLSMDVQILASRMRRGEKGVAVGTVAAINDTAKRAQLDVREEVEAKFTLRKREFVLREAAVIKPFASASQARPYAEIGVGSPGRPKPRMLLPQFEYGGERKPFTPGAKHVAVPIIGSPARPTFGSSVPKALTFGQLRFTLTRPTGEAEEGKRRKRTQRSSGKRVRYGQQDTFLIPNVGVFQRRGAETMLLYAFVTDERIEPDLHFVRTVEASVRRWMPEFLERQIIRGLA